MIRLSGCFRSNLRLTAAKICPEKLRLRRVRPVLGRNNSTWIFMLGSNQTAHAPTSDKHRNKIGAEASLDIPSSHKQSQSSLFNNHHQSNQKQAITLPFQVNPPAATSHHVSTSLYLILALRTPSRYPRTRRRISTLQWQQAAMSICQRKGCSGNCERQEVFRL